MSFLRSRNFFRVTASAVSLSVATLGVNACASVDLGFEEMRPALTAEELAKESGEHVVELPRYGSDDERNRYCREMGGRVLSESEALPGYEELGPYCERPYSRVAHSMATKKGPASICEDAHGKVVDVAPGYGTTTTIKACLYFNPDSEPQE